MNDNQTDPIPTGWQCPVCRKVHAPHVDSCDCHERQGYTWPQLKEKYFPNMTEEPEPESPAKSVPGSKPPFERIYIGDLPGWLNPPYTLGTGIPGKITVADSEVWRMRIHR